MTVEYARHVEYTHNVNLLELEIAVEKQQADFAKAVLDQGVRGLSRRYWRRKHEKATIKVMQLRARQLRLLEDAQRNLDEHPELAEELSFFEMMDRHLSEAERPDQS